MRTLNEYFLDLEIADISTVASLAMKAVPEGGNVRKVYTALQSAISVADADVYLFRGKPLAITEAATADAGASVIFEVPAHGLRVGDYVYIKGSADSNYNGIFAVTAVADSTHFKVTTTFTADETSAEVLRVIGNGGTAADGKITIAYSGSAEGDVDEAVPSGATKRVTKGDIIGAVSDGASTTAAKLAITAVIDR